MIAAASVVAGIAVMLWPPARFPLRRVVDAPAPRPREARWLRRRMRADPFAIAAAFDLFAVCLRAGLPVGTAAMTVAGSAPPVLAAPLTRVAELLNLGADAEVAFAAINLVETSATVDDETRAHLEAFATMARRSARTGSSLAGGLAELAEDTRRRAHDRAVAAAERAGVAISGPLGLCFLPAFICLGIVPVVIGLASTALGGL